MIFKVGDKVLRKQDKLGNFDWTFGAMLSEVIAIHDRKIRLLNRNTPWGVDWWPADDFYCPDSHPYPQPQDGEYWKQRNGAIVGPISVHHHSGMLFICQTFNPDYAWHANGVFQLFTPDDEDLIAKLEICPHCERPIEGNP